MTEAEFVKYAKDSGMANAEDARHLYRTLAAAAKSSGMSLPEFIKYLEDYVKRTNGKR